jgi:NhaP-type Na+/H+ or K+/H+ antiporter
LHGQLRHIQKVKLRGIILVSAVSLPFMSSYLIIITLIGFAALGMAWMPSLSKLTGVSYALIYVIIGVLLYLILGPLLPLPDPISESELTVHLTETVVIISLMGTGLKIDTPFSFNKWAVPFRLVTITMLLSIFGLMAIGMYVFGFDPASALLLGAALAPTDPVLASDVQVGPPLDYKDDDIKFSLTAEAGMNDGTAFPFTWLAVAFAIAGGVNIDWATWLWYDLLYRICIGVAIGFGLGKLLGFLIFNLTEKSLTLEVKDGFVAIASTLLIYGVTEMVHGYGFFAVFVASLTLRNSELHHKYHRKLHSFTDQVERTLVAIVLILFGGSLVAGILNHLTWPMAIFSVAFVLIIRPLTAMIGLIRTRLHIKEKMAISFFGIKGMGSFFYLAFALSQVHFSHKEALWSVVSFVVLLSIIVHGLTATKIMTRLDKEFGKEATDASAKPQP